MIDKILSRVKWQLRKAFADLKRRSAKEAVGWAVVGVGNMSKTFCRALLLEPDARVCAVCSRSIDKARSFASRLGARAYDDFGAMLLSDGIDIVYIATPHKNHYEYIKKALLASKNVICEKPIVSTRAELTELIAIAREKGVFLMEGMWSACLPVNIKAREWIDKGLIGKVASIRVDLSKKEVEDTSRAVFSKDGGVLFDYGIYTIAFCVMFMGENIQIKKVKRENRESGIDKSWDIELSDGAISAHITISSDAEGTRDACVVGECGSIKWMPQFNRTNTVILENNEGMEKFCVNYISSGFEYEIREVHRVLRAGDNESGLVPLLLSLRAISVADELIGRNR